MDPFIQPLQGTTVQVTGKGFGIRAWAYVIDVIVLWIMTLGISFMVGVGIAIISLGSGREIKLGAEPSTGWNLIVGVILSTIYFLVFEWLYGASPGKLFLSLRVVMEDGSPCTFKAALIRGLARYIDGLLFGLPAYSSMKAPLFQRIGDKPAKTLVVGSNDLVIQQARPWWWFLLALGVFLALHLLVSVVQIITLIQ